MGGSKKGGEKLKQTLLAKDPNYFKNLSVLGGKWKGPKGLAKMSKRQRRAISLLAVEARRLKAEQRAKEKELQK